MSRILVVEDEESFSDALGYLLGREGFDVCVADTGTKAIEEFDRGGADLVLLDLMLPGLSGTEVCKQLRSRSNVPIIMLTAKDSEIDKVVGLELGADDYITKPYSSRELVARIRAVLRRNTGEFSVLTRMQLIDRVWGSDYVGDTKTLDVHIKRLRSKIEVDPANPVVIQTVRGLGYKMEA
ncbi:MAG: DNA-binding response regulator [Actinobacteria bacterium]|nr:DNA-binding response regulator [Actinomycetota bacterium]